MTIQVFIDGAAGTTGLEIRERLAKHAGLKLTALEGDRRKDPAARKAALNDADVVILCLPDDAAKEAVALIDNPQVKVIDASTAHRTAPGWTYGFAELAPGQRRAIAQSQAREQSRLLSHRLSGPDRAPGAGGPSAQGLRGHRQRGVRLFRRRAQHDPGILPTRMRITSPKKWSEPTACRCSTSTWPKCRSTRALNIRPVRP